MNPEGIQAGDVVYLKSGSAPMTVESVDAEEAVCIWHDAKGNRQEEIELLTSITKIKPNSNKPAGMFMG